MSKATVTSKIMDGMKLRGDYGKVAKWMRKKRIYTRSEVMAFLRSLGKTEKACIATATVMLSPRESSNRGNCCGNMSNPIGHLMYNDKMVRKVKGGVKEEQKFRFTFRKKALDQHTRYSKISIEAEKVETKEVVKSPAKSKAKSTSKVKA